MCFNAWLPGGTSPTPFVHGWLFTPAPGLAARGGGELCNQHWRYPAFPGALNAPQGTQSPLKRPRMRGSRPDGRPPASAFPEIAPELRVAGDDRISTPQAG